MDISELKIKDLEKLKCFFSSEKCEDSPYKVGEKYFIRTVTMYYTGQLIRITAQELVLKDCAWIADTGYLSEALKTGVFNEIEPFPDGEVIVPRGGIIDASVFNHKLPREKK